MKNLAILASGAGSNAENIIQYFRFSKDVKIVLIASNKPDAGVLKIASKFEIPTRILTKSNFQDSELFLNELRAMEVSHIVLAGFLWKVPLSLVVAFPGHIINIHPALLPKYGGKGMYGHFVHEAVHANREKESGISIHYVNERYDEGAILFQAKAEIFPEDTAADIEKKVRTLEIEYFPKVIEKWVKEN